MTEKHQLLTDQQFEQQFENCTLPPVFVTHEAHLRLAYIHIKKHGIKKAVSTLYAQLSEFDTKFGNILISSKTSIKKVVNLIYDFISKATTSNFKDLILEFPDLKTQFFNFLTQPKQTKNTYKGSEIKNEIAGYSAL